MMLNLRGSVLFEGVLSLSLLMLSTVIVFELAIRFQKEMLLRYRCFYYLRQRVFGYGHQVAYHHVENRVQQAGFSKNSRKAPFHYLYEEVEGGSRCKVYTRYPAVWAFWQHHHFEITRQCFFPTSLY